MELACWAIAFIDHFQVEVVPLVGLAFKEED